jgi:O-antigen ligase
MRGPTWLGSSTPCFDESKKGLEIIVAQSKLAQVPPYYTSVSAAANSLERSITPFTRWAFYAWMFSLPFDVIVPTWLPLEFRGGLSIPRIVGVVLALCFVIDPKTRPWKPSPAGLAFTIYVAIYTVSMLRSDFSEYPAVLLQVQSLVLFFISYNLFMATGVTRGALLSFALSCGIASLMVWAGIAQDDFLDSRTGGRQFGFGTDPNLYSKMLLVGIFVAIGVAHVRKDKGTFYLPLLWGSAMFCMLFIAKSGSRSAAVALGVGLATFILRKGSLLARTRNFALLAVAGYLAVCILGSSEVLVKRLRNTVEDGDTSGRDVIFANAWEMVKEKPLIGWGQAGGHELANRGGSKGDVRSTHNTILGTLLLTGLAGSVFFFWGCWKIVLGAWRSRAGVEDILPLVILAGLFIMEMLNGGALSKLHWTLFAYVLAAEKAAKKDGLNKPASRRGSGL